MAVWSLRFEWFIFFSVFPAEMLFRVLFACLDTRCASVLQGSWSSYATELQARTRWGKRGGGVCVHKENKHTFAGFPTFWPMTFHLLASYSLMAASNAVLFCVSSLVSIRTYFSHLTHDTNGIPLRIDSTLTSSSANSA